MVESFVQPLDYELGTAVAGVQTVEIPRQYATHEASTDSMRLQYSADEPSPTRF